MSDANRIRVSVVAESSFGVTPTNPAWLVLATTGQSMRDRVGYQQSATINNDRNVLDLVRLSKSAGGGVPMELSYSPNNEGFDRLLRAALAASTWTASYASTAASCTTVDATNTLTRAGGGFAANIAVGDIVKVSGASTAANNGYFKVSAVSDTQLTFGDTDNFAGNEACTVTRGAKADNGTTETSFSVEVARLDLQVAQVFTGCSISALDLTVADGAITTANLSFEGSSSTSYTTNNGTTDEFGPGTPTYADPTVHPVLDAIGVPEIRRGGLAYAAKSINVTLANNIQPRTQIGALGPQSLRFGEFGAAGRVSAYLEDLTDIANYRDNVATDLWLILEDQNDRGYSFMFPRVKFGEAGADTRGSNQDDLNEMSVTAIKGSSPAITVRVQRWD